MLAEVLDLERINVCWWKNPFVLKFSCVDFNIASVCEMREGFSPGVVDF